MSQISIVDRHNMYNAVFDNSSKPAIIENPVEGIVQTSVTTHTQSYTHSTTSTSIPTWRPNDRLRCVALVNACIPRRNPCSAFFFDCLDALTFNPGCDMPNACRKRTCVFGGAYQHRETVQNAHLSLLCSFVFLR